MAVTIDGAISQIKLSGFKSIKKANLDLGNVNVLIGANGSGKSNFISFFQMMEFYLSSTDGLNEYVGRNGGASSLVYYGTGETKTIEAELAFNTNSGDNFYNVELGIAIGDKLYFKDEQVGFHRKGKLTNQPLLPLGGGGAYTRLLQISEDDPEYKNCFQTVKYIRNSMKRWSFFQFHNTTMESLIRGSSHKDSSNYLRSEGGNLAAFLYRLQEQFPRVFFSVVDTIKTIAPFIDRIIIEQEYASPYVRLKWAEKKPNSYLLDASQMSDGTLRAIAIITLLMQPQKPPVICIDEPELGLHPEAIVLIADLIKAASEQSQIIISTQSTKLVDCFEPEDIVVVERKDGGTCFTRLDSAKYQSWFDEYSISETWETNIFGGCP